MCLLCCLFTLICGFTVTVVFVCCVEQYFSEAPTTGAVSATLTAPACTGDVMLTELDDEVAAR